MTSSDGHVVKILPSHILYNNCDTDTFDDVRRTNSIQDDSNHSSLDEFCRKVLAKGEYPRLQVVERDRCLYTINNTRLALFQRLEQSGYCGKVRVEVVPLKSIPPGLRDVLCPQGRYASRMSSWGKQSSGYKLVGPSAKNDTDNDEDEDEDENDTDQTASPPYDCYRNQYEDTVTGSSTDDSDDDDDDDSDDDDDDENDDESNCEENGHMHQWGNALKSESSDLIEHETET